MFAGFKKYISEQDLIRKGEGIILAVSGGADSMVLLDLISRLAKPWDLDVAMAHVNYGLRGKESMRDW